MIWSRRTANAPAGSRNTRLMVDWLTFLIVGTAVLGGGLAVVASLGRAFQLLAAERQSLLYRLSYAFMAVSVVAFVLRGFASGRP